MQSAPRDAAGSPSQSRRRLLLGVLGLPALAVVTVASGCTPSDPRVSTDHPNAPTASARTSTPSGASTVSPPAETLTAERDLAALAAAILSGPHGRALDRAQRPLLTALGAAHRQHALALASPEPTTRPTTPSATTSPTGATPTGFGKLSLAQSIAVLSAMESAQAAALRRAALRARGFEALLAGSMGTAATMYAAAIVSDTDVAVDMIPRPHAPMTGVSDVEAIQSMLRQLHAIVYGYQLALGRLRASSASGRRALASLRQHRELRDRLSAMLVARSAAVPAAAAAYVPSTDPTTAGRAATLIRQMETALQPFCGLWLASAIQPRDRVLPLDTLVRTTATARRWNAPLTVWPGWQD